MNKQCKNCRYLGKPVEGFLDADQTEYGPTGFHVCDFVQHRNSSWGEFPEGANVGVDDGSGYFARLVVKGEFGCIEWAALQRDSGR